jgi:DNA-binding transcriptional ArsR family regulator
LKQWGLTRTSVSYNLRLVTTYAEQVFDALGDPTRRSVFERLRGGARSVGELAEGMDVSRPAVSQHLKVLKEARLVVDRAEGTRRLYAVDTQGLEALRTWLEGLWDEALDAFKEAAERETKDKRKRL